MQVDDIRVQCLENRTDMVPCSGMDRDFRRQSRGNPMQVHFTIDITAGTNVTVTGSCRDDMHLITTRRLGPSEGSHLGFDTTRSWGIAVGDVGDPHTG